MITQQDVEDAFRNLGGPILLQDIYYWLENHVNLTESELTPSYGQLTYKHGVRSHISDMVQAGKVKWLDTGLYLLL